MSDGQLILVAGALLAGGLVATLVAGRLRVPGLVLFEGGLAAGFQEIRPVLVPALSLALVGTIGCAVLAGFAAVWLFDLSNLQGLLIGSVIAATDGAAIFAVLRGSTLRRRVARTLEGESGLNDPVAVLLVLGFMDWIQKPGYGLGDMALLL